jgi:hypothetical protein
MPPERAPYSRLAISDRNRFAGSPARVGMRSRASRRRLSDNDIRCSASDRRWFPARPAQRVHGRRNNGKCRIPSAFASAHRQKRQKTCRDIQHRTRRSASTIGGAAPDSIIGGAAADRAGARPYRATRFGRPPDDITIICMRDGTLVFQVSNQAGDA